MSTILAVDSSHGTSKSHHKVAAATTNATSVKAGSTTIVLAMLSNPTAANKFVKFFDKATAPTLGTDVPKMTVLVPPGRTIPVTGHGIGLRFSSGLAYAITGAIADNDATAVAAGDVSLDLWYE